MGVMGRGEGKGGGGEGIMIERDSDRVEGQEEADVERRGR
jgi:hypothetical protein